MSYLVKLVTCLLGSVYGVFLVVKGGAILFYFKKNLMLISLCLLKFGCRKLDANSYPYGHMRSVVESNIPITPFENHK